MGCRVPRSTGALAAVRELHVWHLSDGRLLDLEAFLNAPAPLLRALEAGRVRAGQ
jgi:hypothetical protein